MKEVFLEGRRIYLRNIGKKHLKGNYIQWFNDQRVCKYNSHGRFPNSRDKMEIYLKEVNSNNSNLVLAIIYKRGDMHIGNISLQSIDWISRNAEFAIIMGEKRFWGRGVAKEAADLILRHGFVELNLHRIYCGVSQDNIPMQRLAVYLGMKKEGIRRESTFKNGSYRDTVEFGVIRKEFIKI